MNDEFVASNGFGVAVPGLGGYGRVLTSDGEDGIRIGPKSFEALREFFLHEAEADWQAKRDKELGRERFPEFPDFVVRRVGDGGWVQVLNEGNLTVMSFHRSDLDEWHGTPHAEVAGAYFAAHPLPEPRPWEDAGEGEVWALTVNGKEIAMMRNVGVWAGPDFRLYAKDESITDGFPLWVDGKPVNGQEGKA